MAVLQTIRNFFVHDESDETAVIIPAAPTVYEIRPLTDRHQTEVTALNLCCFKNGENYTKHTFAYLLGDANTLSYRVVTSENEMVGFVFVMLSEDGAGHLTTIGVSPEHRRRGIAKKLLIHIENSMRQRNISTVMLEVRVSNEAAQNLYRNFGYSIVQRVKSYYNNGEDCFLMVKSLC